MAAPDEIIWQVINHQFCSFKSKYVPRACGIGITVLWVGAEGGYYTTTRHHHTHTRTQHAYRLTSKEQTFCRNPYNVTGLCLRSACPLANSRYATIREHDGACL